MTQNHRTSRCIVLLEILRFPRSRMSVADSAAHVVGIGRQSQIHVDATRIGSFDRWLSTFAPEPPDAANRRLRLVSIIALMWRGLRPLRSPTSSLDEVSFVIHRRQRSLEGRFVHRPFRTLGKSSIFSTVHTTSPCRSVRCHPWVSRPIASCSDLASVLQIESTSTSSNTSLDRTARSHLGRIHSQLLAVGHLRSLASLSSTSA